eukprot:s5410_g5.t1
MGKCACQREDYGTLLSFVRAPWHFAGQHLTQMSSRPSFGFGAMDTPREDNPIPLQRSKTEQDTVNKYLLLLRIVLAEVFKDLRTSGWQLQEVKDRADVLLRPAPHRTNSASSVGIIMQLTRVLWDELLPQLEQSPKASPQAVLALLEPFVGLAEGSYVEGLVRSVHENVFRRVPEDLVKQLKKRLLAAANGAATQKNREALCDTVAELEKRCLEATAKLAPDEANLPSEGAASKEEPSQRSCKKKRKRKVRATAESQERVNVSPLMLPKAALPLRSKVLAQKQKKKRQQRLGLGIDKEATKHDQKVQVQHTSQHEVFPQLANEAARKKKTKRKVSFDLNKNEVVRFSEKTPVSKMKACVASEEVEVRDVVYEIFVMAHSSAYEENGSSRPVGKFWSLWFSSGERGS